MTERPVTDVEFEVIEDPRPLLRRRWAPLAGLSPVRQVLAVVLTIGALAVARWLITAPIAHLVDRLFAAAGHG